jgi:desulfoferrodoxin-like iron-binding protein
METPQVGTRHRCETCGTEVIVVKAPDGAVACCGQPMVPVMAEQR